MGYDNDKRKNSALVGAALGYLKILFGAPATRGAWAGASGLPYYLIGQYRFLVLSLDGAELLLAEPIGDNPTPAALEKHVAILRDRYKGPVAVLLASIDPVTRARLLARRIPFIVPSQQLYIPALGLALRERYSQVASTSELLQPAAQYLVVMLLLGLAPATASAIDIAKATGYSAMTASRILNALEAAGIVTCARDGRTRRLLAPSSRRGLWERARPHLGSPVDRTLYLRDGERPEGALEAGYLALSHMSDLAEPGRREYAIDAGVAAQLKKTGRLVATDSGEDSEARVQVWSYRPIHAQNEAWIDPFSLYLSLDTDDDERVRKALDSLLEAQWSKE
jgi:DNA-binding transcriptional ArsR family regulator